MFLTRVMPVRDAEGHIVRWFGTNTDISERKATEEKLAGQAEELTRQAEELIRSQQDLETQKLMLQSVLDSMEEGLVAADEQGKFIIWNPAAARIVGLGGANVPPEEWGSYYGAYLPDMITPFPTDQNPLVRAIRGELCSTEIFIRNAELEQGVWIESNGAPLRDKDGALHGGVVAFRDITQKKAAELEIRKLNETLEERIAQRTAQLEVANRELESFTYSVSHDLRAPLRHIMGFAGACLEEFGATLDPQALHYVQRIQDGTRRMGVLTDELLNLARTGQRSMHLQLTGLNSIVEELISMLKTETEGREVEWKIGSLPSVECDPVLVRQVFQNLLSNAIKYSRRRPHAVIEIGHTQEKDQQIIFVRDNGAGFNMQYADKLFGVFQRLHRDEEFEGTGVGLATVHRIVQKHGGRIWAEAEVDHGATFYFTLGCSERAGSRGVAATAGA
jgi:signal transduction histidine kinase